MAIILICLIFLLKDSIASKETEPSSIQSSSYIYSVLKLPSEEFTNEELQWRIIACESGTKARICNRALGCKAGMGLWMFISGTWNRTLERIKEAGDYLPDRCFQNVILPISPDADHPVFDYECNLMAGRWLLDQDGDRHWAPYSGYCYKNL